MFEEWKETFLHPSQSMPKLAPNANLGSGLQHLAVGFVISGIISAILIFISSIIAGPSAAAVGDIGLMAVVFSIMVVFSIIVGFIGPLLGAGLIWIMAKILGGKGEYGQQLHMTSAPLAFLMVVTSILNIIPLAGALIGILLNLYYLYPMTVAIREAHKFSTLKAIAAWLLPIIIVVIIVFIFAASMLASLGLAGLALKK